MAPRGGAAAWVGGWFTTLGLSGFADRGTPPSVPFSAPASRLVQRYGTLDDEYGSSTNRTTTMSTIIRMLVTRYVDLGVEALLQPSP